MVAFLPLYLEYISQFDVSCCVVFFDIIHDSTAGINVSS